MTLPFALNSEPWKIFTLEMDSMDFPSMGLMTLQEGKRFMTFATLMCWKLNKK